MTAPHVAGLLLAAGSGSRYGRPKALVGGWLADRAHALLDGGCAPCVVVLGAGAEEARLLVPAGVDVVVADDWHEGMAASFRAGLRALERTAARAVVVTLVDTPGVGAAAVGRLAALARDSEGSSLLAQAAYDGVPGHPVLLGRDHWSGAAHAAKGDRGARAYLAEHAPQRVECGDVGHSRDVDVDVDAAGQGRVGAAGGGATCEAF
ncbi:nucleotidyltransferase family protein [Cellulomonas timonensis]|uniref:nucleotidyltransferase family protein n=1 Tax=Cellulomonas timonensis TaxID=1689271 RepID=UPI000830C73D|nr:nucleotidyltransferase family protein [Cellulomonas timonensis]